MILAMSEILKQVSEIKKKEDKIAFLRKHDHPGFRELLALTLRPDIKWCLPEGRMDYRPCVDQHDQKGMLYNTIRKMYLYVETPNHRTVISQKKREDLFVHMLESIDPGDAEMLMVMKDKKMPFKISEELIKEAYPDLL